MEYQAALGHTQNDNEQRVEVPFAEASLLNSCSLLLSGSHVMSLIVAIGWSGPPQPIGIISD
jgi:hypothetical protein